MKEYWLTQEVRESPYRSKLKQIQKKDSSSHQIKLLQTNTDYKILWAVREKETLHTREKQYE